MKIFKHNLLLNTFDQAVFFRLFGQTFSSENQVN